MIEFTKEELQEFLNWANRNPDMMLLLLISFTYKLFLKRYEYLFQGDVSD